MKKFFATDDSAAAFILRLVLGLVIFPHGAQKLFGWFGGFGFSGTMGAFTESMGIPAVIAFLVIIGESFGAVGLIAGFLTRFAAASMAVIMVGAISIAHWQHGFFMNWFGNQAGQGYEYHLLVIGMSLALMIMGAGSWSVDQEISKRLSA